METEKSANGETSSLDDLVVVASSFLHPDFNDKCLSLSGSELQGEAFHQLFVWTAANQNRPKVVDVPYTGHCRLRFNDLKIIDKKLFVLNTSDVLAYDLDDLSKQPRILEGGGAEDGVLAVYGDRLVAVDEYYLQSWSVNDLTDFRSLDLVGKHQEGSLCFPHDPIDNVLGAFSIPAINSILVNTESMTESYLVDLQSAEVRELSFDTSRSVFSRGQDYQSIASDEDILVFSLNDWERSSQGYPSKYKGFSDIKCHRLTKGEQGSELIERKPIDLDMTITSILLDEGNLKILAHEEGRYKLVTYDIKQGMVTDQQPVNLKFEHANSLGAYLTKVGGDIKIVNQNCQAINVDNSSQQEPLEQYYQDCEIYVHSLAGKHEDLKLTGAKGLSQLPVAASVRPKFCEIVSNTDR